MIGLLKLIIACPLVALAQEYTEFTPWTDKFENHAAGALGRHDELWAASYGVSAAGTDAGGRNKIDVVMTWVNGSVLVVLSMIVLRVMMAQSRTASSAETAEDKSLTQVLPSVLTWAGLGISLIIFNKLMYTSRADGGFGFPCPMALTWWHMFTGLIMTNIIRLVRPELMPAVQNGTLDLQGFMTSVVPIGIVFSSYLAIGNVAYLYLSVSFVQMLKSAGPIAVHAIAVSAGMEQVTAASATAVTIVVLGVFGASVGEVSFSWFGFALQFTAFLLDGVRLCLFKVLMSSCGTKLDPLSGLFYYSPVCILTLIAPVAIFEGEKLQAAFSAAPPSLFGVIVFNGLLAFALNLSLLSLFANASATTVSVASVIRDVFLTFFSAMLFHTEITRVQALGYFSACLGVKLWDEIKARPDAFNAAFGLATQGESLPLVDKK